MPDDRTFASYAVMCELNRRELRRRIGLFPGTHRHHVVMASAIIGAENARRMEETPPGVTDSSAEFVAQMMDVTELGQDGEFTGILETCLIETMKDELGHRCPNCTNFTVCLGLEDTPIGDLFRRCAEGEETGELKKEVALRISQALQRTPHLDTHSAHLLCENFLHQYSATDIGEVFNRYADIAAAFRQAFGADYRRIQQEMVRINMEFVNRNAQKTSGSLDNAGKAFPEIS